MSWSDQWRVLGLERRRVPKRKLPNYFGRKALPQQTYLERQVSCIRLSDKTSRLRPRHVVPKPGQTYELEVLVEVREWIAPPLLRLTLCLKRNHRRNRIAA